MKKIAMAVFGIFILFSNQSNAQKTVLQTEDLTSKVPNIYKYKVIDINGEKFDFAELKGKKILIVNTASNCGYTKQYKELEELYQKYKDNNVVIVGFPSNDFGGQEPGTDKQIAEFCTVNYGVTFPMMSKVVVKGEKMTELYQFLTQKSENGLMDSEVKWNFQKYLINEKGELVQMYSSKISPMSDEIVNWIKK